MRWRTEANADPRVTADATVAESLFREQTVGLQGIKTSTVPLVILARDEKASFLRYT